MFKKIVSSSVIVFKLRGNYCASHIIKAVFSNIPSNYSKPPENSVHVPINDQLVDEIFKFKDTNISNWIIENKVDTLCCLYKNLPIENKQNFLWTLALKYGVDHKHICHLADKLLCTEGDNYQQLLARETTLKKALTPRYHWLFILMGRLEGGVKFLVDLRTDVLELLSESADTEKSAIMQQLNLTLHDLLLLWFSVGFLHLERITWQSSCDMLQKVSDYEAIHPIKNWVDLKRRVGPYRRCYIFTHPSMPREPLVVLHTALCDTIPETVKGIEEAEKRIVEKTTALSIQENVNQIKAAVFYSISTTQKGLQGIELGNYLIKEVAKEVTREFPMIDQLSSLSPIPKFRLWLLDNIRQDATKIFTEDELMRIKNILSTNNITEGLKKLLNNCLWMNDKEITDALKEPLMRACAWYLYREKRRNYALNAVANFHLRNGAVMWRVNWMADPSPRGSDHSCGLMVNYRYFLSETEDNSRNYIEGNKIKASEGVMSSVLQADKLRNKC
ncbi:malonyl-CoA decarboxylase, mitochondrial-like [Microplitis mediator]|uniref:malonyl-CoA decarboxylase, mitochondrial-like n=1 Tax=Microplitis mediator TaxID=375433 RepID=UPI0025567962|nr:malonyl-CoA decarboxylase, mitochondrial-like [Microplitis mediator]